MASGKTQIILYDGNMLKVLTKKFKRGKPKPRQGKGILAWRSRQRPGAIMKPGTFESIKEEAKRRYGVGEKRAIKVAGKAYWQAALSKFRGRRHA